ncbi:rplL, partial [Acrasis kona]
MNEKNLTANIMAVKECKEKRGKTTFPVSAAKLAEAAIKSGYMVKQDKKLGIIWRKRFLVLTDVQLSDRSNARLYYFENIDDNTSLSLVDLADAVSITKYSFSNAQNRRYGLEISCKDRKYWFICKDELQQKSWIEVLNSCRETPTKFINFKNVHNRREPPKAEKTKN